MHFSPIKEAEMQSTGEKLRCVLELKNTEQAMPSEGDDLSEAADELVVAEEDAKLEPRKAGHTFFKCTEGKHTARKRQQIEEEKRKRDADAGERY